MDDELVDGGIGLETREGNRKARYRVAKVFAGTDPPRKS